MPKQLKTHREVIAELGGFKAVCKITGDKYTAVWNWTQRGFPPETYLVLKAALAAKDCEAPVALWGMREPVVSVAQPLPAE